MGEVGNMMVGKEGLDQAIGEDLGKPVGEPLPRRRERLRDLIIEKALIIKEGAQITLASGLKSNFFFDMKTVLLSRESSNLITAELLKKLQGVEFNYIGGKESGAIPIVALICANSAEIGKDIEGFFVRKEPKGHGERKSGINNKIDGNLKDNTKVVIVDDVTTTGDSILDAINEVKKIGCTVVKVITIVDRCQGADEKLANLGLELDSLFTARDFGL